MELKGFCHCKNIKLTLNTQKSKESFVPRRCDCSYCEQSGAEYISDPDGSLLISTEDEADLGRYRFDTKTAEFLFCRNCGIMVCVVSEIDGNAYAVVNHKILEDFPAKAHSSETVSYGGELLEDRLKRRAKNWISNVEYGKKFDEL